MRNCVLLSVRREISENGVVVVVGLSSIIDESPSSDQAWSDYGLRALQDTRVLITRTRGQATVVYLLNILLLI